MLDFKVLLVNSISFLFSTEKIMGFGDCRVCIRWVTTVPEYHMTQFELDYTSLCTSRKLKSRVKDNHDLTRFQILLFFITLVQYYACPIYFEMSCQS